MKVFVLFHPAVDSGIVAIFDSREAVDAFAKLNDLDMSENDDYDVEEITVLTKDSLTE
jgi:hypothetical protein